MAETTKTNLNLYNALRSVPDEAIKKITGGRLNGFSDINPMWRIKALTEQFGPCGFGWYADIVERWQEEYKDEIAVFVKIHLFVKSGGEWSKPIVGVGGSKVAAREKTSIYFNDEGWKMAYTDAISVACKALGMAADIYFNKDVKVQDNRTKYDQYPQQQSDFLEGYGRGGKKKKEAEPEPIYNRLDDIEPGFYQMLVEKQAEDPDAYWTLADGTQLNTLQLFQSYGPTEQEVQDFLNRAANHKELFITK